MFLSSKIIGCCALVAFLATTTTAYAASTNPWALPQQQTRPQANMQGGFNMGGGFTMGGGTRQGVMPQFVAPYPVVPQQQQVVPQQRQPQQVIPQQAPPQQTAPQQIAPVAPGQQFGVYPPLSNDNTATALGTKNRPVQPGRPPGPGYMPPRPYGYMPYGYNSGNYGFPGFGNFGNMGFGLGFGGGFGNGFGNGFGSGLVAPAPGFPGYGYPYYQGYQTPQYQTQPQGRPN